MTLRTSSVSKKATWGLFGTTLRKNVGLLVLMIVGLLLLNPGLMLTDLHSFRSEDIARWLRELDKTTVMVNTVYSCGAVLLLNFVNFQFLYTKRAGDVFFALPLTRTSLLFARAFSSFVLSLVPSALGYIAVALVHAVLGIDTSVKILLGGVLFTVLSSALFCVFSLVFIVAAGNVFDLLVSFATVNIGPIVLVLAYRALCQELLLGYTGPSEEAALQAVSPVVLCGSMVSKYLYAKKWVSLSAVGIGSYLGVVAWIAVCLALAVLLFGRRPSESSGNAYAFRFMPLLCSMILSVLGGFALGMIFAQGQINALFWIFVAVGCVLAAVVFGAMTSRGFKTLKTSFAVGGSAFALTVLVAVILSTGGFGYTTRMPKVGKIQKATVTFSRYHEVEATPVEALDLHRETLKYLDEMRDVDYEKQEYVYVRMAYTLKNGKVVERSFHVPQKKAVKEKLLTVYKSPARINQIETMVENTTEKHEISVWQGEYLGGQQPYLNQCTIYVSDDDLRRIASAYVKDLPNATMEGMLEDRAADEYTIDWWREGDEVFNGSLTLRVEPSFEHTRAVLEELDLEGRAKARHEDREETGYYKD